MAAENYNRLAGKPVTPLSIINIQVERCTQTFGVTCSGTGEPCDQARKTCPVPCDFVCKNYKHPFTTDTTDKVIGYVPNICKPPKYTSGRVDLCSGMARPSTVTWQFQDFENKDILEDPYLQYRSAVSGTSVEKFIQRNRLENRLVEVSDGFCEGAYPADFINRDVYIDNIDGPTKDWKYTVTATDALGLIGDENAKYPAVTTNKTYNDILPTSDTAPLLIEAGNGFDEQLEAICMKGEVFRVSYNGSRTYNQILHHSYSITERAVCNSTRNTETIPRGTPVQKAAYWPKGTHLAEVLFDILHADGDGLPYEDSDCDCGPFTKAVLNPIPFRRAIQNNCYAALTVDETYICTPESKRTLIKEISQFLMIPYKNECTQLIELSIYEPPKCDEVLAEFKEELMIDCELTVKAKRSEQISDLTIEGNPDDCTKGISEDNLEVLYTGVSKKGLGSACNNPDYRGEKVKELKNRFLRGCNAYLANSVGHRLFYILTQDQREIKFKYPASLMPADLDKTQLINVTHKKLQNARGQASDDIYWINNIQLVDANCYEITASTSGFKNTETWAGGCNSPCHIQIGCDPAGCDTRLSGNKIW